MTDLPDFIHELDHDQLPAEVVHQTRRCLLDLIGVAAAGSRTWLSRIIRDHAAGQFGAGDRPARLIFDGRPVSPAGAALAGGMTIDAFDAHDGHALTKGHAGAALLPALLALHEIAPLASGRDFLAALAMGYEVAIRAGIALHRSAADYHTSGAWSALGCAALGARLLGLDRTRTREALGIAEYHGPRSPMMRCIDHPTMVKDGSGWGAMTGISAALLAADGFTGAPADTVEHPDLADLWADLGERWRILDLYFKPYPVCRWAQPAVTAARELKAAHRIDPQAIATIEVRSFHQACRLAVRRPADTEQAQYSLPFPVAAALRHDRLGAAEIDGDALHDPRTLRLSEAMTLHEDDDYNARFPAERWARVRIRLHSGEWLTSAPTTAPGDPDRPLSDEELLEKFRVSTAPFADARFRATAKQYMQLGDEATALAGVIRYLYSAPTDR
ncbi:MAG: MmgE/PrpD family protein [Candidatus Competibacterales bacterium]|nr:MmgE/PrpD family protein [Candidatus Competibacterales bacterium]